MIKAIKEYWNEVTVPAWRWMTRHWKGFVAFYMACYAVAIGWLFKNEIKKCITEKKFSKKEEES